MKRKLCLLLLFALVLTTVGCGTDTKEPSEPNNKVESEKESTVNTENNNQPEDTTEETDDVSPESWGSSARWVAVKSGTNAWETYPFYVNFPKYAGYTEGNGLVAEQLDDTVVIVAAEYEASPAISDLKEFMPA